MAPYYSRRVPRDRLPPETFELPVEKIRAGYYTDAYFNFARDALLADDRHPLVLMQVFQKQDAVLGGMDEAIAVLEAAHGLGVPLLPGIATPTEALAAHRAGALLQKLFPSPAGGPDWVRACLGPLPFLRLVPTSGVTVANASAWLAAGCFAVGCVGTLFDPEDLAAGRFVRVEERARACLFAVAASARSKTGNSPGSEMAR